MLSFQHACCHLPHNCHFIFKIFREECDRLIRLINSRVIEWPMEARERTSVAGSAGKTVGHGIVFYGVK